MTEHDFDESALLAATRRAFSPTPAEAERVLHATRASLAGGAASAASATPAAHVSLARAWLPNAIGALSIAMIAGVVGYRIGLGTGERPAREADSAAVAAEPAPAAPAPLELAAPAAPAAPPQPANAEPLAAPQPRAALPQRTSPQRATQGASEPSARSMQQEIDAMRRVDRVLHDRDPRRALALLYELDRNVPNGKLMQEREAAFAMARCALGLGSAQQLASDFAARYPGSVYLQRVQQTCTLDQRNEAVPETHE